MIKQLPFVLIVVIFSCMLSPQSAYPADETITISTYYPAPYGIYKELRSQRIAIGENYINSAQYCWAPNACTNQINADADLVVEGRVGIGTTAPDAVPLHVYSGTTQGIIGISGASDTDATSPHFGETYSGLYLADAQPSIISNSWGLVHKKKTGEAFENDFQIVRWRYPTMDIRFVIDEPTGNVGVGNGAPQAKLDVAGGVKIADDTSVCDANKAGTLRYNAGKVQYCNGTVWGPIYPKQSEWVAVGGCIPAGPGGNQWCWEKDNLSPTQFCKNRGFNSFSGACRYGAMAEGALLTNNYHGKWGWSCHWGDGWEFFKAPSEILCTQ